MILYEYPFNERIRTYLRLEQLFRRMALLLPREHPLDILLQVNVSGEASKDGFDLAVWQQQPMLLDAFSSMVERIAGLPNLHICGLMTIAPIGTPDEAQQHFHGRAHACGDGR